MTELALWTNYAADRDAGNFINFLQRLNAICYESDDGSSSHKPYKVAVAVKSLHNFINPKLNNPRGFKRRTQDQI